MLSSLGVAPSLSETLLPYAVPAARDSRSFLALHKCLRKLGRVSLWAGESGLSQNDGEYKYITNPNLAWRYMCGYMFTTLAPPLVGLTGRSAPHTPPRVGGKPPDIRIKFGSSIWTGNFRKVHMACS